MLLNPRTNVLHCSGVTDHSDHCAGLLRLPALCLAVRILPQERITTLITLLDSQLACPSLFRYRQLAKFSTCANLLWSGLRLDRIFTACTDRKVWADFVVCDWWRYCKALCVEKVSQIKGNDRKFSHIELSNSVFR